jgi:hypothetical protein
MNSADRVDDYLARLRAPTDLQVDARARSELAFNLRRLVTGQMTNDEFDDFYYSACCHSKDRAVVEIGEFGYCLYSSDLLLPYRLKGRHRVAKEVRRIAARCILFLATDRPYEWPKHPDRPFLSLLMGLLQPLSIAGPIALFVVWILFVFGNRTRVPLIDIGLPVLAATLALAGWFVSSEWCRETDALRQYKASGDYEVWPFLKTGGFEEARRGVRILGRRETT